MALLIKQWGKYVSPCNEYIVQAAADLSDIDAAFGDRAYAIDEHTHYIFGTTWTEYYAPTASVSVLT